MKGLFTSLLILLNPYSFLKNESKESEIHAAPVSAGSA